MYLSMIKDLDKEGWLYGGVPAKPIKPLNK